MLRVTVGNNVKKCNVIVSPEATPRQVFEENGIDYTKGAALDGATLMAGEMDKTFADFGVGESCFLTAVTKQDNA